MNYYDAPDLLTGQLVIIRADGSEHRFLYDSADHELVASHKWIVSGAGYAETKLPRAASVRSFALHRLVLGLSAGDGTTVDHVNGDRTDNRLVNLRITTVAVNATNRAIINNTGSSKYRGVCWANSRRKWKAYGYINDHIKNIGWFDTEADAAAAVAAFRALHYPAEGYPQRHAHTPSVGRA